MLKSRILDGADIFYIQTTVVLYLFMIRDLYDNSIVAYKTGTQQTVNSVPDTIRQLFGKKRGPPQSSSSTATKGFSIFPERLHDMGQSRTPGQLFVFSFSGYAAAPGYGRRGG